MTEFNFSYFLSNINVDIKEAEEIITILGIHYLHDAGYPHTYLDDVGEKEFNQYSLEEILKGIIAKVQFAIEYLTLPNLLEKFNESIEQYKIYHKQLKFLPFPGVVVNNVLEDIKTYINAITCQNSPESIITSKINDKKLLLERILMASPKIIKDNNLDPSNEAQIRNAIYNYLTVSFPSTVKEVPIAKVSKVYKPDIGVKELKIAIEYKFSTSLTELKKAIGGIFEDIKGYAGSEDWKYFYAVIYQTDHFMTQAQIEAEFELSGVEHHWKPILVYGLGKRLIKPKSFKNKTSKKKS